MSLASLQKSLLPKIEDQLKIFFQSLNFRQSHELQGMIAYHMGWKDDSGSQGKRIRPLLTLLTCGACDGEIGDAMPAAVAIEFLHNFTLIHDDIEDNAPIRHGRETLWEKWGLAQGVNAGDALFSVAQLAMLEIKNKCGQEIALEAMKDFNQTCLYLTQGQYMDIAFESSPDIHIDDYLAMTRGKTAALISLTTRLGGLTAHQDEKCVNLLGAFGEALGMAFQIQDDYLGIWGNPEITGKSTASDLAAKKKTLPIIYGLEHSEIFSRIWSVEEISEESLDQMSTFLTSCGAQEFTKNKSEEFTDQAFSLLERLFPQKNHYSEALFELAEMLLQREN